MYRKTYIEINANNLRHNVQELINNYPGYKYYFGIVKGDVYGHGYSAIKPLVEAGVNYLAVSSLEEAIIVRQTGFVLPTLCLQPIHLEEIADAVKYKVTITVSSYDYFKKLINLKIDQELKIHLKINSGMNRLGLTNKDEVREIFDTLKKSDYLQLEGIFSHFATSGVNDKHWDNQVKSFKEITSLINLKEVPIVHLGRSLTLLQHDKIDFCNGVRMGIVMYGYFRPPQKRTGLMTWFRALGGRSAILKNIPNSYQPAFSLYSEIIETQRVKKGSVVGYGAVFKATQDCVIGIISIGYADGFARRNNGGFVVINGKRYQIIAIDMGITTVLIDDNVKIYDKVELIGDNLSIYEVAKRNGTIVYEILCMFKESLPRFFSGPK